MAGWEYGTPPSQGSNLDPSQFIAAGGGSTLNGSLEIALNGSLVFTDANGVKWYSPSPMVNTSGQLITQMISAQSTPQTGYVGATQQYNTAAAASITLPPNIQTGDKVLLFITAANNGVANTMSVPPSGYSLLASASDTSGSEGLDGWLYEYTATAGGTAMDWGVSNNNLSTIETALGHPADIVRDYGWLGYFVSSWSSLAAARKMALSMKFRTNTTNPVAATAIWNGSSGSYDTDIQDWCTAFVNMPAPPSGKHQACFEHELNASAAQASGTNAQLIAAVQHCITILRNTPGFNTAIHEVAVCLTGAAGGGQTMAYWFAAFESLYIPGTWADVVWIDQPYVNNATTSGDSLLGPAVDWMTTNYPSVPLYVGEWGWLTATLTAATVQSGFTAFAQALKTSRYANLKGLMYWSNGNYVISGANLTTWASLEPGAASEAGGSASWTFGAACKSSAIAAVYRTALSVEDAVMVVSSDVLGNTLAAPAVNPGGICVEGYGTRNGGGNTYSEPGNVLARIFSPGSGAGTSDALLVDSTLLTASGGDVVTASQQFDRGVAFALLLGNSPIGFVASSSALGSTTTVTASVPNSVAAGNTIFLFIDLAYGGTDVAMSVAPAGYTLVGATWSQKTATATIDAWIYAKTAVGADAGAAVTATFAAAVKSQMSIIAYSGVSSYTLATGGDTAQTIHTIPTVTASKWVVAGVSSRSSSANTYTGPAGYTQRLLQQGAGGGNVDSYITDSNGTSSTGGGSVTGSVSASVAVMWALALS